MQAKRLELVDASGASHVWEIGYYPADEGLDLLTVVAPILSPVLGLGAYLLDEDDARSMSPAEMDKAISGAFGALRTAGPKGTIGRILRVSTRDGVLMNEQAIGQTFAGNYGELVRAVAATLQHNFASFFAGFDLGRLSTLAAKSAN